jgi:hypothetical protein
MFGSLVDYWYYSRRVDHCGTVNAQNRPYASTIMSLIEARLEESELLKSRKSLAGDSHTPIFFQVATMPRRFISLSFVHARNKIFVKHHHRYTKLRLINGRTKNLPHI